MWHALDSDVKSSNLSKIRRWGYMTFRNLKKKKNLKEKNLKDKKMWISDTLIRGEDKDGL